MLHHVEMLQDTSRYIPSKPCSLQEGYLKAPYQGLSIPNFYKYHSSIRGNWLALTQTLMIANLLYNSCFSNWFQCGFYLDLQPDFVYHQSLCVVLRVRNSNISWQNWTQLSRSISTPNLLMVIEANRIATLNKLIVMIKINVCFYQICLNFIFSLTE